MHYRIEVNGRQHEIEAEPDMPLLWVLRDLLDLKGTKYGCGVSLCGACTVHLNGAATRSCITPLSSVGSASVTTIEGIAAPDAKMFAVQYHPEDSPGPHDSRYLFRQFAQLIDGNTPRA